MAIKTKTYLQSLWITNYRPTQTDFSDLFDTVFQCSVSVNLTGRVLDGDGLLHFQVDFSTIGNFSSIAASLSTLTTLSAFEYYNGSSVTAFPVGGLGSQYRGDRFGNVICTWTGAQEGTKYYVRCRAYDGFSWGEYVVGEVPGGTTISGGYNATTMPPAYNAGDVSGDVALDYTNSGFQLVTATNDMTFFAPNNGAFGAKMEIWITGSLGDHSLGFDSSVIVPSSDFPVSFPKTITAGKTYFMTLRCIGASWCLTGFTGGYS